MTMWIFFLATPRGPQPFAALFTERACDLLIDMFRVAGAVGQCFAVAPGVAS